MARLRLLHWLFELGVTLKFIAGALELLGAALLLFVSHASVSRILSGLLTGELLEDPRDAVAGALLRAFQSFSASEQRFAVLFLAAHGILKIGLALALWSGRRWAYPLSGLLLLLFTAYQGYLFALTGSLLQLVLVLVDVALLALLRYEYARTLRGRRADPAL